MKKYILILSLGFFVACADKAPFDINEIAFEENYKIPKEVDKNWYKSFNNQELNSLIDLALKNSYEIRKADISLLKALASANLIKQDKFPTFDGNAKASTNKDISSGNAWNRSFSSSLSVNYEVDLFSKIASSYEASAWNAKASFFDKENIELAQISAVTEAYFKILYLKASLELLENSIKNQRQLKNITKLKIDHGKENDLALNEVEQNLLSLEIRELNSKNQIDQAINDLKNLLFLSPKDKLTFLSNFDKVKFSQPNLNIPYYAISNRPDLKALGSAINARFFDYQVAIKDFYPNITLGGSLSANSNHSSDILDLKFLGGNIALNLPFLNYNKLRLRKNIKEADYNLALLDYEKALNTAVNEVNNYYKTYQVSLNNYKKSGENLKYAKNIYSIYLDRYNLGTTTMKDLLQAQNTLINSEINLVEQKYNVLSNEIGIYKALGARYKKD